MVIIVKSCKMGELDQIDTPKAKQSQDNGGMWS